ncbi:MAG: hypothetical protein AB8B66_03635 [Rickettsiaceae bacterium]
MEDAVITMAVESPAYDQEREANELVFKTLFLAIDYITRKWSLPIRDWGKL